MVVGMSEEHSAFICWVSVERHVHVVVECMVRDMHFAVIEVGEVKRASVDTLPGHQRTQQAKQKARCHQYLLI